MAVERQAGATADEIPMRWSLVAMSASCRLVATMAWAEAPDGSVTRRSQPSEARRRHTVPSVATPPCGAVGSCGAAPSRERPRRGAGLRRRCCRLTAFVARDPQGGAVEGE